MRQLNFYEQPSLFPDERLRTRKKRTTKASRSGRPRLRSRPRQVDSKGLEDEIGVDVDELELGEALPPVEDIGEIVTKVSLEGLEKVYVLEVLSCMTDVEATTCAEVM